MARCTLLARPHFELKMKSRLMEKFIFYRQKKTHCDDYLNKYWPIVIPHHNKNGSKTRRPIKFNDRLQIA